MSAPPSSKIVVYLSGSVGDLEPGIIEKFKDAANKLCSLGYVVINPCNEVLGLNSIDLRGEGMRRRFMKLMISNLVITLESWPTGEDGLAEERLAHFLDMPTYSLDNFLIKEHEN